ncbi:MAG: domain containing protein [Blastococcus sp.]|nr:domain containing protein [Blastococcus sp.]
MHARSTLVCGLVIAAILATLAVATGSASAGGTQASIVSALPDGRTPQILDSSSTVEEKVLDLAQVGNRIVVVGVFSQVRDVKANGGATYQRSNVFAFDPVTGAVDPGFDPLVNGEVRAVLAGSDGADVYLGGTFTQLNGVSSRNVVQVSLATGERTAFRAPQPNGAINDLALAGGRLILAGQFTTVGGVAHGGLASLDSTSGALDDYLGVDVAQHHNYPDRGTAQSPVGVEKIAVSADGSRMAAIGNFRQAEGLVRDQAMIVLLGANGPTVDPTWRTRRLEAACKSAVFDSYVRDLDFAPDGSYFVIVTTGAPYAGTLCDSASRWDVATTGQDVQPRWVAATGGDTLFSTEITGTAVYVGGHQRWMNNPSGADTAGAGAVPRPGLAALDPRTGIPLSWNPGRSPRGIGAQAMLATSTGLYVGMDTEYIGNRQYLRSRLAYFPLAGGAALPSEDTGTLPANVFMAGRQTATSAAGTNDVRARFFTGATVAADEVVPTGGVAWSGVRGAFMAGDTLFYGAPDSAGTWYLWRRTFDGTTYGPATAIDPYNDPYWSTVATGSTRNGQPVYYRGARPTFYGQLPSVTGMFFRDGRLYYTRSGVAQLFYRSFSVDSGVVGQVEYQAATTGFSDVAGTFVSGNTLYWATSSTGELRKVALVDGAPSGVVTVAAPGPASGGRDWRTRAMFLGPGGPNQAPTAAFESSCAGLVCSFDAGGSADRDGTVAAYAWNFGDGTTGAGVRVTHTFPSDGSRPVTLTVTDDGGATAQTVRTVTVTAPPAGTGINLRAATGTSARAVTSVSVTVPASVQAGDALLLVLSTNSDATGAAPAGFVEEGTQASGTNITTRLWSRLATAADAGTVLTVPLTQQAKVTLQVLAYSGVSAGDPVASVAGALDIGGTSHTTPSATAAAGSWIVSVWSDKQSAARSWSFGGDGATVRDSQAGIGSGDIATLVADSGVGVPAGGVGGLTATVPAASNRATMFTVVLTPAG